MAEPATGRAIPAAPAFFPFITVRPESSGTIVFNPFLGTERVFDANGSAVIGDMDGGTDAAELAGRLAVSRAIPPENARSIVEATLSELRSLCALREEGEVPRSPEARPVKQAPTSACTTSAAAVSSGNAAPLSAPLSVIWEATRACNLNCAHCLNESGKALEGELDDAQARELISILEKMKVLKLFISGGEPFIRPGMLGLLERLSESKIYFDLGTNGFQVPDGFYENLPYYRLFQVQVSLDAMAEKHDAFRGRTGAFAAAARTVERLLSSDIDVSVSATATAATIDQLPLLIDYCAALGCTAFKAISFLPAGRGGANSRKLGLTKDQYRSLSELLRRKEREWEGRMTVETGSSMNFLLEPCSACSKKSEGASVGNTPKDSGRVMCSAGNDTLYIGADGTVFPCPFFQAFPLGNVRYETLESIWTDAPFLNRLRGLTFADLDADCRNCGHLGNECNGGCRASAYLAHGDIGARDPSCFK